MRVAAHAPGRIELLGNHTDYNEGLVLAAAIDRRITVSGARRGDGRILLRSALFGEFEIDCQDLAPQAQSRWANYSLGIVRGLLDLGVPIDGFAAKITSTLPIGCGLSSSAALEVATALFLLKMFPTHLPPLQIARLCQITEERFAGVQCGLLDPVISLFGRADHAVFFDARSEEVKLIPFPSDLALVVAESGRKRELSAGLYNQRRVETQAATAALGLAALRDISPNELEKRALPPLLRRRAAHIAGENERVKRSLILLAENDGPGLGALLNESHASSHSNFENSTPELDLLVESARKLPGVFGARLTGGGFGGATVTLCERSRAANIAEQLARTYFQQSGIESHPFVCALADGAD